MSDNNVVQAAEVPAIPSGARLEKAAGRSLWMDLAFLVWPVLLVGAALYWARGEQHVLVQEAMKSPPRVVVIDELRLMRKVVLEEGLSDVDSVRDRVQEVVRPYTDIGYVVVGELSIVSAPNAIVLSDDELDALYERSKR